jgi:exodeoxyribonuclease VII small subunit
MARKTKKSPDSFEDRLARLEDLVARLEAGNLPLEQAVSLFEEGVRLSSSLHATLTSAEKRIEALLAGENGQVTRKALDVDWDDESDAAKSEDEE